MLPFICRNFDFKTGDFIYIENLSELLKEKATAIPAKHVSEGKVKNIMLDIGALTDEERDIILDGCLINYNKRR